jgi:hypothetical protein
MNASTALLVAALLAPVVAHAAGRPATCATLPAVFANAQGGDVIRLAGGRCGDVMLRGKAFEPPLRIVAADPARPPVLNSLRIVGVQGVVFEGLHVAFEPTATTYGHQNLVAFEAGSRVIWRGGNISAGAAVNGVTDGVERTPFNTVKGWPLGRGVYVAASDAEISGVEITGVERGVVAFRAGRVTIEDSHIHDIRRTMIMGAAETWRIESNLLETARPWRWGETPRGDHANYVSIQFGGGDHVQRQARIAGNATRRAADGVDVLGFVVSNVEDIEIVGNLLEGTDHQGLVLTSIQRGVVSDNALMGRAQILLRLGVRNLAVTRNLAAAVADYEKGATGNLVTEPRRRLRDVALPAGVRGMKAPVTR